MQNTTQSAVLLHRTSTISPKIRKTIQASQSSAYELLTDEKPANRWGGISQKETNSILEKSMK
jgi:hypothetical protein